jgi:hypothetical protein
MPFSEDRPGPAIEDLRRYGRSLADAVPPSQADAAVTRALAYKGHRRRSGRLVLALAVVGLLAVSNVGLAVVSNNAAPGDFLYAFDRGYEWAGDLLGTGNRTRERLLESEVLDRRGQADEAIALLREELAADSTDQSLLVEAIDEIERRADRAQGNPPELMPPTPATTAPGQVEDDRSGRPPVSPSETAPGQVEGSPSDDAPGQTKEVEAKLRPGDAAAGKNQSNGQPTVNG